MVIKRRGGCAIVAAAFVFFSMTAPGADAAATPLQFEAQLSRCQAAQGGAAPVQGGGELPLAIDGVTTVTAKTADCVIKAVGPELIIMAAMDDAEGIANAWPVGYAGYKNVSPAQIETIAAWFLTMTEGRRDRPILVYCHHAKCPLSYVAAQRLRDAGHSRVLWMREGINGWKAAGLPVTSVRLGSALAFRFYFAGHEPGGALAKQEKFLSAGRGGLPEKMLTAMNNCIEGSGIVSAFVPEHLAEGWLENVSDDPDEAEDDFFPEAPSPDAFQKLKEVHAGCMAIQLDEMTKNDAAVITEVIRRFIQIDTMFEDQYRRAVAELKADPARYFPAPASPEELRETLRATRAATVVDACGKFDYSLPAPEVAAINARIPGFNAYKECLRNFIRKNSMSGAETFLQAARWANAVRGLRCTGGRSDGCISRTDWQRVADVVTAGNVKLVKEAQRRSQRERTFFLNNAVRDLNEWEGKFDAIVDSVRQ